MVCVRVVRWGGESEEEELGEDTMGSDSSVTVCSGYEHATEGAGEAEVFAVRERVASGVYMEG